MDAQESYKAFYAYPGSPADLAETIESAAAEISGGNLVTFTTWRQLSIGGSVLIEQIAKAIEDSDVVACDLTDLNHNVLFELGYAIALEKRIWISINASYERALSEYRSTDALFPPVGYAKYINKHALENAFYSDQPWTDLRSFPSDLYKTSKTSAPIKPQILYIKSNMETDASIELTQALKLSDAFTVFVDDPAEMPFQPLTWYVEQVWRSAAVVVHLLSDTQQGARLHNAKCSLVGGMAYGYRKPLLMLAHAPFESPIDYRTLLQKHSTSSQCRDLAKSWLADIRAEVTDRWQRVAASRVKQERAVELRALSVGEVIAEQEEADVTEYFVRTNAYWEAMNGHQSLFVGRKGTGKTANMYALESDLSEDKRNHVCVITPVDYEVEGILRMLRQSLEISERGFLVQTLWKFLIFTELANSIKREIENRPTHVLVSKHEEDLLSLMDDNKGIIQEPFSIRLEGAVKALSNIDQIKTGGEQRIKISEALHEGMLAKLRNVLGEILSSREKVVILVDNLDKAWGKGDDVDDLSQLLFGLLSIVPRIAQEFRHGGIRAKRVNMSLIVFIRSDIFSHVISRAREQDKLDYYSMTWEDDQILWQIIDERLSYSFDGSMPPEEIWVKFFPDEVNGYDTREYIIKSVLRRPRHLIYFVRTAIAEARSHKRGAVDQQDILSAQKKYSKYALRSLFDEDDPRIGKIEDVLTFFIGAPESLSESDVRERIAMSGVDTEAVEVYFQLLKAVNFLGFETLKGETEYMLDESRIKMLEQAALVAAERDGRSEPYYSINKAFHEALDIGV